MKKHKKVIVGIVFIFIVSMMIIPISALVIRSTINGNDAAPLFLFDLSKTVLIYDILFLYYTIVLIPYFVYIRQHVLHKYWRKLWKIEMT